MKIIAATKNRGKMAELDAILKDYGMQLLSWDDAGLGDLEIEETGTTCEENSYIKAKTICDLTGLPALADDTGLFVDAAAGAEHRSPACAVLFRDHHHAVRVIGADHSDNI